LDRLLHARDFFPHDLVLPVGPCSVARPLRGRLDEQLDGRKGISEFVGDACSQFAYRGQSLGTNHLSAGLVKLVDDFADLRRNRVHLLLQAREITPRAEIDPP
jgi:hypothetical protein